MKKLIILLIGCMFMLTSCCGGLEIETEPTVYYSYGVRVLPTYQRYYHPLPPPPPPRPVVVVPSRPVIIHSHGHNHRHDHGHGGSRRH